MFEFLLYILTILTLYISHSACVLLQFKKAVVDRLTKTSILPVSHIGILWKGSSATASSSFARRINLLGMKGPDNYFSIFLPEEDILPEKKAEGLCVCMYMYVFTLIIKFQFSSSLNGRVHATLISKHETRRVQVNLCIQNNLQNCTLNQIIYCSG